MPHLVEEEIALSISRVEFFSNTVQSNLSKKNLNNKAFLLLSFSFYLIFWGLESQITVPDGQLSRFAFQCNKSWKQDNIMKWTFLGGFAWDAKCSIYSVLNVMVLKDR